MYEAALAGTPALCAKCHSSNALGTAGAPGVASLTKALHGKHALVLDARNGNLALDLILEGRSGRLVNVRNGVYDNVPLDVVVGRKKVIDVDRYYDKERLRPIYKSFSRQPVFIMTSDV